MSIHSPEQARTSSGHRGPLGPSVESVVLDAGADEGWRWEASYGPIDGSPAVWATHRYATGEPVAVDRQRLPLLRPDVDVLRHFFVACLGSVAAEDLLYRIGPLDLFYAQYRVDHPGVAARGRQ